jgi:hypothetical protein
MGRGQQLHVGADLDVVADADARNVEEDQAEVREGPCTDSGLVAIVATERRANLGVLAVRLQQLDDQPSQLRRIGRG